MAVQFKDYYETLGLSRDADAATIRKAYRDLARKYHPDVSKEPDAAARFSEVNEAYEVLKDEDKRKRYDQFGHGFENGQDFRPPPGFEGFAGGGSGFSDFFEMLFGAAAGGGGRGGGFHDMFGGAGPGRAVRPRKGGDAEAELRVTLEELLAGGKTEVSLRDAQGGTKTLSVGIPPGSTQGTRIRLGGQGSPGHGGGPAGDLLLRVRIAPHPSLSVEGTDLRTTLDVTPWEAALGAKVEVRTLDGEVDLSIPPGTPSERVFRLRGLGLRRTADERGDLLVKLRIVVPEELNDDERRLLEELADKSSFRPRES